MYAFGVTHDRKVVEWFDTMDEAVSVHQQKPSRYEWVIIIYAFSERICTMNYNPLFGYFATGFITDEGVNLIEKYHLDSAIFDKNGIAT